MGRPRMPEHRVAHGTPRGWMWHYRVRRDLDPTHVICEECRIAWNKETDKKRKKAKMKKRTKR